MIPILLDTDTGEIKEATGFDSSLFQWSENNYSCDCNRSLVFGKDKEQHEKTGIPEGHCLGERRFIAIDVKGDLGGHTNVADVVALINKNYPEELIKKFISDK